ncbi:MAG: right-handed parallel beta-helix repeat-containing protein [Terracidiphilus sp.]
MARFFPGVRTRTPEFALIVCFLSVVLTTVAAAYSQATAPSQTFHIDCSAPANGDGSVRHPWNSLATAESHEFAPGDTAALARGTVCTGSFAPKGSGTQDHIVRLTAYGHGPRPRIVAPANARQILLLSNQQYWQIDSLDLSGASNYGIYVTGDKEPLHHIYLKNLYVHDVHGGPLKNKDNGLVVVGPSGPAAVFDDVLVDGVDAAHTNQWSGILIGGGPFAFPEGAPLNRHVRIVNSTVHDVYGDGIILFRDEDSSIRTSAAWQTGMQPTQDVGTPNAIWTWTCARCTVEDNEAFLTDSPGVDGGAYDIDWDNTDNTVQRNYGHDTQGYCIAVFGAGYVTANSEVRENLCVDNGLSPRLAASCGAICITTWNGGAIRGLRIEQNRIQWNPRAPGTPAIVDIAQVDGAPIAFSRNVVESASALIYRVNASWAASRNVYRANGEPAFSFADRHDATLSQLQSAGNETGSSLELPTAPASEKAIQIDASIDPALDADGLLMPEPRAQLLVLRSLAGQFDSRRLRITVHLPAQSTGEAEIDALRDLESASPGELHLERNASPAAMGTIRLESADGRLIEEWRGFQNAATLGGAVRARIGAPDYSPMQKIVAPGGRE